ncbi:MAG: TrmH family RNA methyltransferase [Acidimicrobiales bacterium]
MTARLTRTFANAYRDPGLAVLEGFHPARHALRFGAELRVAVTYDRPGLTAMAARLAPESLDAIERVLQEVDRPLFDKLSPRSLTSPLLSVASRPRHDLAAALADVRRPVVHLEAPRDPGNVGAVIRVAAAAGVAAVLVSGQVDPWSPVVLRSATGLQYALPVAAAELPATTDRPVVAVDVEGEPLRPADLHPSSILVVGGERYGLPERIRRRADRSVAVPMRDGVSSMNLATAVAALLFSWRSAIVERTGAEPW